MKILTEFDLRVLLPEDRAVKIKHLWEGFHSLYIALCDKNTDSEKFRMDALDWLKEFLSPGVGHPRHSNYSKGLYTKSDITPYIHILIYHIHEFIDLHKQFGLKAFSCSPVERKNGMQTSKFFHKTTKDGGKNNQLALYY